MEFLLDSRKSHYGTSSLYNDKLAQFQGPSLYTQNNALFQEKDWEGIQSLMLSNKKVDPLKVGRFGIGFNAVYHLTGLLEFLFTTPETRKGLGLFTETVQQGMLQQVF